MTHPPAPLLPPPYALGLPPKFTGYRPYQDLAIVRGAQSKSRFVAQCAPVGFGKSMNVILQAVLADKRAVVLTATKGLQDQYFREFASMGLVDQRGRDNYPFPGAPDTETCESGPCLGGAACQYRGGRCPYDAAVRQFNQSKLAVTNYAWWLAVANSPTVNPPDILILDEAHDAPHQLEAAVAFQLMDADVRRYCSQAPPLDPPNEQLFVTPEWTRWAMVTAGHLLQQSGLLLAQLRRDMNGKHGDEGGGRASKPNSDAYRRAKSMERLGYSLSRLTNAGPSCPWVWERLENPGGWAFHPLHPAQYAESYLFRGVPRIVLTSGTLTPHTLELMGLTPQVTDYQDYPSPFDPRRAPIYQMRTGIAWKHNTPHADLQLLVDQMDYIIGRRLDRKGIIHSVSYNRQRFIWEHSAHQSIMWGNSRKQRGAGRSNAAVDPAGAATVVAGFKAAQAPALLVSPTVTTGWDFPGQQCEFQLIPKLPFPDATSRIMRARAQINPLYAAHLCAVELQQMCGRGMRGPTDQCETFIMDDNSRWFLYKHRDLFNAAFFQFLVRCDEGYYPPPPPPLPGNP